MKYINNLFIFISSIFILFSCRSDRFSHSDKENLYYWKYDISGDSILQQFHKPRTVELKVYGGYMKYTKIKVDVNNNGFYRHIKISRKFNYSERRKIVKRAIKARRSGKPIIGIFKVSSYPYDKVEFIKYKE